MPSWQREQSRTFGRRGTTVEVFTRRNAEGTLVEERVTVISGGKEWLLPVPPIDRDSPFTFDRFVISPDDRTVISDRKVYSGTNEAFISREGMG